MQRVGTDRAGEGFLTAEQQRRYGRYAGEPDQAQLDRYFHLDTAARELVDVRRWAAPSGSSARSCPTPSTSPGRSPRTLPPSWASLTLGCSSSYAVRDGTNRLHAGEIQQAYGYRDFTDPAVQQDLLGWLEARTALASERPGVLFDLATARLLRGKGATARPDGAGPPRRLGPRPGGDSAVAVPGHGTRRRRAAHARGVCSSSATGNVAQPWTGYAAGPVGGIGTGSINPPGHGSPERRSPEIPITRGSPRRRTPSGTPK